LENCELVTKREDLSLQGGSGSKTGGYQSEKGDDKESSLRYHQDLTNDRNLCIFRSDGVFGNHNMQEVPESVGRMVESMYEELMHGQAAASADLLPNATNEDGSATAMCMKEMVGTTGLEPATSTVSSSSRPLTQKELITGGTGRTVILGAICYQIATKTWQVGSGAESWGIGPFAFTLL
jgi:hypothetical protein